MVDISATNSGVKGNYHRSISPVAIMRARSRKSNKSPNQNHRFNEPTEISNPHQQLYLQPLMVDNNDKRTSPNIFENQATAAAAAAGTGITF